MEIKLDMKSYLKQVINQSESVKENKLDIDIARARYHERRDRDTQLITGKYNYNQLNSPYEQTNQSFQVGGQATLVGLGTVLSASISNAYTVPTDSLFNPNNTNNTQIPSGPGGATVSSFSTPEPTWISTFSINASQPLLRNGPFTLLDINELNALHKKHKAQSGNLRSQTRTDSIKCSLNAVAVRT